MAIKKREKTPMEKLTHGYEKLMKGKELSQGGKNAFDKAIKNAAKPKQHGSK